MEKTTPSPGLEDLSDVGVAHQGQDLPLSIEAGHHLLGVHAQLDDLEGHTPADRLLLLGLIDRAHPAFAQNLDEAVVADALRQSCHHAGRIAGGQRCCSRLDRLGIAPSRRDQGGIIGPGG